MTGRSLAVQYNVFFEQKEGNRFDQYEDAFALDGVPVVRIPKDADRDAILERSGIGTLRDLPRIWRVAVADGATGSSFSQLWARHLVESFISSDVPVRQDFEAIREFTAQAADSWNTRVIHEILSGYKPGSMRHLRVKNGLLNTTQAATLLLMEFDTVEHTWRTAALGDTMVFQFKLHGGEFLIRHLNENRPFRQMTGDTFGNNPILVTSSRSEQDTYIWKPLDRDDAYAEGSFEPEEDVFLLMTDAIAAYFLYLVDYIELSDLTPTQFNEIGYSTAFFVGGRPYRKPKQDKSFAEWAAQRRTKDNPKVFGRLKNDDITLIRLRFTTKTEGDTTPYEVYPHEVQTFPPLVELVEDDGPLAPTTPPPVAANTTRDDDANNRQLPSAKSPFSNTPAAVSAPQTTGYDLPDEQPQTVEKPSEDAQAPLSNPVDMSDALGTSSTPPVRQPASSLSASGSFDLPAPAVSEPLKQSAKSSVPMSDEIDEALKKRHEAIDRKKKANASQRPAPAQPTTPLPEYQQTASNAVTMPVSSDDDAAPRTWFVLMKGSRLIRQNDDIQRILERIEHWDDPQFSKIDTNTDEVRRYITQIWQSFKKDDKYRWTEDISIELTDSANGWERTIRTRIWTSFDDLRRSSSLSAVSQVLYLIRIYMLTWRAFQYMTGILSVPSRTTYRSVDEIDRQEVIRNHITEYRRIEQELKNVGGKVSPTMREFWNLCVDYAYKNQNRFDVNARILKLKL